MGKDNNRSTVRAPGEIFFQPRQLFCSQSSESTSFQIDDVHEGNEVYSFVVKAVPPGSLGAFAVALEILLAVIGEHVMFAGHEKRLARFG